MRGVRRGVALALAGTLLGACATMPPEQAALRELAWEVAKECEGRFAAVTIQRPDQNGRVRIGSRISGEGNRARQCYRETMRARQRSLSASGGVTPDAVEDDSSQSPQRDFPV